ncbi:hypothetical protein ANN_20474 [Periplaneta americana]|uniref:Reverse transcriptase domain-containing protein n=1 Tax=Periplaneta americana TaxID=6978 RepID=A0ABQ8SD07_PERAM|nr:hypothetical protein ANN_20474 [Periplaneta americana]
MHCFVCASLVHDVLLDEDSTSSKSDDGDCLEDPGCCSPTTSTGSMPHRASGDLDDEDTVPSETRSRHPSSGRGTPGSGMSLQLHSDEQGGSNGGGAHLSNWVDQHRPGPGERRRRKLPEIPKNRKSSVMAMVQPSLADELGELMDRGDNGMSETLPFVLGGQTRPLLVLKCHSYLRDEDSSPDSERFHSTDVDSGNSTAHSPDGPKSMSPQLGHQAGYTKWDHKHNEDVMEELQLEPVINHVKRYQNNWINHLHRMRRDRIPKIMLHYRPNGKRSLGRPKKRWIENSTECPGLHQLLVYADDVNMLGENPQKIRENTGILLEASKEIGLEVNNEKKKYMIMSRAENIVRTGNIKIGNLSFEEVEKFKYLGATVTNINDTREEIKHRINMRNACYYSVEKLLSSSLLSKNLKVRIYKTVMLPVVLYGCETWTLTLREEHRLRVFENKVLRKIFEAKRDDVTGEWRKLHNTELHALYSSPDIIRNIKSRRLRWAGHVARMGESRNAYRVLVRRPEGKRPSGRPRHRWEDNVKMDLREVGYDDREWINLAQDRDQWRAYVRAAMNLRVP